MLRVVVGEVLDLRTDAAGADVPVMWPMRRRKESTMSGNDATNLSISCVNTGTISAISPPITTNASTRPIGAPTPRGIPRRWSIEANDDNGTAMITISTASRIVASCSKIIPATTRPNASRTVRYSVPGVILESDIADQGCPIPRQVSRRAAVCVSAPTWEDPAWRCVPRSSSPV